MIGKIVERLAAYPGHIPQTGLARQAELLQLAADNVAFMVRQLRKGTKMDQIREANERLAIRRGEADKIMLSLEKELYEGLRSQAGHLLPATGLKWWRSPSIAVATPATWYSKSC